MDHDWESDRDSNPRNSTLSLGNPAWDDIHQVALIGSYVPRRCGIATFTDDLATAIHHRAAGVKPCIVALNDRPEGYRYPARVAFEINQPRPGEYRLAADFLNMSKIDVVSLQHEFGLFGGPAGAYIIDLIRRLRMPVITTLHTVLKDPDDDQRRVTLQLAEHSDRLVVMAHRARDFLRDIYGIDPNKVQLIHHGIPDVPFVDPNFYKDQFDVEGRRVILTFGLIGPSKGIENMIEALPAVVKKHPDVMYIVLGATHPGVIAHAGEEYRLGLQRRVEALGLSDNVRFVNKYATSEELKEFLGAADLYVTPYHNEAQITSGTLAYALGFGKCTISTPYWYAQEMLADGRGALVPMKDNDALAEAINHALDHETDRHAMRKRAYQFTRGMRWPQVASEYLDLFARAADERAHSPRPSAVKDKVVIARDELPEIKLDHLATLSDDTGIFHRAHATVPDRHAGYATDDNARVLIAVLTAQDHLPFADQAQLDAMTRRSLAFLDHAFDTETGTFRSRMGFDRQWLEHTTDEDCHGRTLWALGETVARCQSKGPMNLAADLFHRALPACEQFNHPHGWAYALIGIHAYLRRFSGDSQARRVREHLAHRLLNAFEHYASDDWPWVTDTVSYTPARIPQALLLSGRWMFNDDMIQTALRCLDWLLVQQTGQGDRFAPIGSEGWLPRSSPQHKARFNQRPKEASATIDACLEAHRVTADERYVKRAQKTFNWFLGDNDLNLSLYDPTTGGCHDQLLPHGLDENQSAEATIAWLLSLLTLHEHQHADETEKAEPKIVVKAPTKPSGKTSKA